MCNNTHSLIFKFHFLYGKLMKQLTLWSLYDLICIWCMFFKEYNVFFFYSKWTICGSYWIGAWICFVGAYFVGAGLKSVFMSKLEHLVATHRKWVLMSFPAVIFCIVTQPYGSTEMSAAPAGANILQPPWWHCHQSFTYTQVIACSRHIYIFVCVYVCVKERERLLTVLTRRYWRRMYQI